MAKLIYSAIASLDGYIADEDGNFDWAAPDEEVHAFVNDLERPVGTYLYGRRHVRGDGRLGDRDRSPTSRARDADFARIWQAADKIVYSTTLDAVTTRQDAARAGLRSRRGPAAEGAGGQRPQHRRPGARRPGVQGRPGRRVPPVRSPRRRRGRQTRASPTALRARGSSCWTNAVSATASSTSTTAPIDTFGPTWINPGLANRRRRTT